MGVRVVGDSRQVRRLLLAVVALGTVLGLFAMHGLPMHATLSAETSMPGMPTMSTGSALAHSSMSHSSMAHPASARPSAADELDGCGPEHSHCVTVLRGQSQVSVPAAVVTTLVATEPSFGRPPASPALVVRGPPPDEPSLTELSISRT